jgi:fatty-acyl-CoA synthase
LNRDALSETERNRVDNDCNVELGQARHLTPSPERAVSSPPGGALGAPGRALVVDEGFDFGILREHLSRQLPGYALPVFLRFCRALAATETFKQKKQQLIREGFNPSIVSDQLFLRDPATGDYRPLDRTGYARIVEGGISF